MSTFHEVIPSYLGTVDITKRKMFDGNAFSNTSLHIGEVTEVFFPDNPKNCNKKVPEYSVLVQHRTNGTAASVIYPNCILASLFGGLADKTSWTLRGDTLAGKEGKTGKGSKVLILCVNGERSNPVILGGIRDSNDLSESKTYVKERGHYLNFEFNGITAQISTLGGLKIFRRGPTLATGEPDTKKLADDKTGQTIELTDDGGVTISSHTGDEQQSIKIDHANKKITIKAQTGWEVVSAGTGTITTEKEISVTSKSGVTIKAGKDLTVSAPSGKIKIGNGADQSAVLGDDLVAWLRELTTALGAITVTTAVGPSSPPINAPVFLSLNARLQTLLAQNVKIARAGG